MLLECFSAEFGSNLPHPRAAKDVKEDKKQ
jgi:hypothetical protein